MCADHVEPRFVEKLTKSRCARTFVLRVWIAVGLNADDPVDHGVDSRSGNRSFLMRIRWPISVVHPPSQTKLNALNDMPIMIRRLSARLRHVTDPKFVVIGEVHLIGGEKCEFLPSAAKRASGVNSARFVWRGRPVNQFETCVPGQLKRLFSKRTTYRKQRAVIMSHSWTPNTSS